MHVAVCVSSYIHTHTRIMTHRCVLSKYRQPFLRSSKGEQEKWWGINRKFQFVGQSIITTFEWANWKWTHWELSRVQLNAHSGATVPAEEKKRKEKQKNTYLELNEKSSAARSGDIVTLSCLVFQLHMKSDPISLWSTFVMDFPYFLVKLFYTVVEEILYF